MISIRNKREIRSTSSAHQVFEPAVNTRAFNESDTNADTCCLGKNLSVLPYTNRLADVYPYNSSYKPMENVPIVTGATAWTDPFTGETFILVFNEALFYGHKLDHSLLNPNQLRQHGLDFWNNSYDVNYSLEISVEDKIRIPLSFKGTKLSFKSRVPTNEELNSCLHIEMTSLNPWNPHSVRLGELRAQHHRAHLDFA